MSHLVVTYARMNPPTIGHTILVNKMKEIAVRKGADARIYLSSTHDNKNNPLDFNTKHKLVKRAFENVELSVSDQQHSDIFSMLRAVSKIGHYAVTVVVGDDRLKDGLTTRLMKFNAIEFKIPALLVVSAGARDDSDTATGMSATKMREWAKLNDYASFENGLPDKLKPMSLDILTKVREACQYNHSATL